MKKNIFKKIVASLATVAMAAGLFTAMPAEEAKAAKTTKLVVELSDATGVDNVLLDIHNYDGGRFLTPDGEKTTAAPVDTWGRELYKFTKDGNRWVINVEGSVDLDAGNWTNLQIVVVKGNSTVGFKYWMANDSTDKDNQLTNAKQWNENDELYFELDMTQTTWPNVTAKTEDPNAPAETPTESTTAKQNETTTAKQNETTTAKQNETTTVKQNETTAASTSKAPSKLYVVGTPTNWGEFKEMKAVGNGVFTYTFEGLKAGSEAEFKFTLEADWKGEVCGVDAEGKAANFKAKVGADGKLTVTLDFNKLGEPTDNQGNPRYTVAADSKALTFTAPTAGAAGTQKPGDVAPVMLMLAVAAVAAGMVVASKKKTICE